LKYEKSNLIHIQTNEYLVILIHKIDTLITEMWKKQTNKEDVRNCFPKFGLISESSI